MIYLKRLIVGLIVIAIIISVLAAIIVITYLFPLIALGLFILITAYSVGYQLTHSIWLT
jgi:hypothetical protein